MTPDFFFCCNQWLLGKKKLINKLDKKHNKRCTSLEECSIVSNEKETLDICKERHVRREQEISIF